MIGLGKADDVKEQPILKLLDTLLSADTDPADKKKILEDEFDIPMSVSMTTEVNEMCNLGEGLVEITKIKNMIKSITSVMSNLNVDVDKAMEILDIESEDKDLYREKIAKLATPAS